MLLISSVVVGVAHDALTRLSIDSAHFLRWYGPIYVRKIDGKQAPRLGRR
jgi:hypothetical protein